jgi:hypothetical protein
MGDKAFKYSLIALTSLVVMWIVLGLIMGSLSAVLLIIIGLIVEVVGGSILLYFWGKSYMSRT